MNSVADRLVSAWSLRCSCERLIPTSRLNCSMLKPSSDNLSSTAFITFCKNTSSMEVTVIPVGFNTNSLLYLSRSAARLSMRLETRSSSSLGANGLVRYSSAFCCRPCNLSSNEARAVNRNKRNMTGFLILL